MKKWMLLSALGASACVVNETELPEGTQCAAGSIVTYEAGAWICKPGPVATRELPDGTACQMGQVATFSGGVWICANAAIPPVMAGAGLVADDGALAVDPAHVPLLDRAQCRDGQVVTRSSTAADGWACSTPSGVRGPSGADGASIASRVVEESPPVCATGGRYLETWRDANGNGVLDAGEQASVVRVPVCRGADGIPGPTGTNGSSAATGFEYFNTSGMFTVPNGVTRLFVEVSGGGGGGGGGYVNANQSMGGGQGGWGEVRAGVVTVAPGNVLTISIGDGGAAGGANGGGGGVGQLSSVTGGVPAIQANGGTGGGGANGAGVTDGYRYGGTGGSGGVGGFSISSRNGQTAVPTGTALMNGYSEVPGGGCSYARGEGGCGGSGLWNSGRPGVAGIGGYVKIQY